MNLIFCPKWVIQSHWVNWENIKCQRPRFMPFALLITNQDHQCALYNSRYMTTNLNQKLKYSVAFSLFKLLRLSQDLINRVWSLDLETYWSGQARLALTDSATICCMRFLVQFSNSWLNLLSTFSPCSSGTPNTIIFLLRSSPSATSLTADAIFRKTDE